MSKTATVDSLTNDVLEQMNRKTRKNNSRGRKAQEEKDQDAKDASLFAAIGESDYAKVKIVLNEGANVNAKAGYDDHTTITPLIHAINSRDPYVVDLLLNHADIIIDLDHKHSKELELAADLEEAERLEGLEESLIPYVIQYYIGKKNELKETKKKNIKEIKKFFKGIKMAKESKNTIPSLNQIAKSSLNKTKTGEKKPYYGGKRKTCKKNSRGRKTPKTKRGRKLL